MKKQFILDLIEAWIIAVCENRNEAVLCEKYWASAILLVSHRWKWDTYCSPDEQLITKVLDCVNIPVLARVRHWHFAEARIAQDAWACAIVESHKQKDWISKEINKEDFDIPIITEIEKIEEAKKYNWSQCLLLWDYWSWNVVSLIKKLNKWDFDKHSKVFVWWWISSPADLNLIDTKKVKWFFIWTALFHFDTKKYFKEVVEILK